MSSPHNLTNSRQLVLLDRDGVINVERSDYVKSVDEWEPILGSIKAIKDMRLKYEVAVCTNQSIIGRGVVSVSTVDAIHEKFQSMTDEGDLSSIPIYVCPHRPEESCACRKPKTGLLVSAMENFFVRPSNTYFVGDSLTDVEAAQSVGCIPILVRTGKGVESETALPPNHGISVFDDLGAFSRFLVRSTSGK